MKSRISFFDSAVFQKNLTRFAPVWGLYTVFLLLSILLIISEPNQFSVNLSYTAAGYGVISFAYALICALLLFGDLYNPRLCNALHAMPVRRESLFVTNIASGLAFSIGPTLLALVLSLGLSVSTNVENALLSPLMCFAVMNLQFLFFFGTAVLCAFLAGNRFAMALIYGIVNFFSFLMFWLVDTIYTPFLYGLKTLEEPFALLCPVMQMLNSDYIDQNPNYAGFVTYTITAGDGWGYLGICAAIGLAFIGLALLLYRRGELECAGDFLAEKAGEPVFLVIYSLVIGCVFHFVWRVFIGDDTPILLFVGLVIGFFTGQMLLSRTVRVFRLRAMAGCVVLLVAVGISLILTAVDPLGIQTWIPEKHEVKSVSLYQNQSLYDSPGYVIRLEDAEDIETVLQIHDAALNQTTARANSDGWVEIGPYDEKVYFEDLRSVSFALEYRLQNGTVVRRYYRLWANTNAGSMLKELFSRVECVLGVQESELEQHVQELTYMQLNEYNIYDRQEMLSLLQAVAADCKAGTMAQSWAWRDSDTAENVMNIYCHRETEKGIIYWYEIQVFDYNEHTLRWLEAHNVPTYQYGEGKY